MHLQLRWPSMDAAGCLFPQSLESLLSILHRPRRHGQATELGKRKPS